MHSKLIVVAAVMLATSVSAQMQRPDLIAPRPGALSLSESDAARSPIPAKRNQLIDIYLNTEAGMEWKITGENNIRVDGLIAPNTTADRRTPRSDRPAQTVVRIGLSDMGGYWGMTMVYARKTTGSRTSLPEKSVSFKFRVS